jgi:hypothetical protein
MKERTSGRNVFMPNAAHVDAQSLSNFENSLAQEAGKAEWAQRREMKDALFSYLDRYYPEGEDTSEDREKFTDFVHKLPTAMLAMLHYNFTRARQNIPDIYGDPDDYRKGRIQSYVKAFSDEGGRFFELIKTGTLLHLKLNKSDNRVKLINCLDDFSAGAWVRAMSVVPTAPVLGAFRRDKTRHGRDDTSHLNVRIYTRYCGRTIAQTKDQVLRMRVAHITRDQKNHLDFIELSIRKQRETILKKLFESGIVHGHLHTHNFTVEYILRDKMPEPFTPESANAIPGEDVIFSLAEALDVGAVPIVRVIDFDQAYVSNEKYSFAEWIHRESATDYMSPREIRSIAPTAYKSIGAKKVDKIGEGIHLLKSFMQKFKMRKQTTYTTLSTPAGSLGKRLY